MADRNDKFHADFIQTCDHWLREGGILITSDYIIDETLTLIRVGLGIDAAEKWWGKCPRVRG